MLLPYCEEAFIPLEKLVDYLLSESHAAGRTKARFFSAHGFTLQNAHALEASLLEVACKHQVTNIVDSIYGTKYVVDGILYTPLGTQLEIRTIWVIETDRHTPRFVTAYPLT